MADIELVIKISEEEYINIKNAINSLLEMGVERASMSKLSLAVLNGTPLPKDCGNLIGVQNAVDNLMEYKELGIFGNHDKRTINGCIDRIMNHVEPIIKI